MGIRFTEEQYDEFLKRKGVDKQNKSKQASPKSTDSGKKRKRPTISFNGHNFDSRAELIYYRDHVYPLELTGEVTCELHKEFELLPKCSSCGQKLKRKVYHPDFILHHKEGNTKVVEIKGTVVKKLQRDYNLRKHLFIDKYCVPNGWTFEEVIAENLTGGKGI